MPAKRLVKAATKKMGYSPYQVCNAQKNKGMPASKMESCVHKVTAGALKKK